MQSPSPSPTGEDGYEAIEPIEGRTLDEILMLEGPFDPPRAASIGGRIASALAEAHEVGLVHGSLTPSKVLIGDDGYVTLLDFGEEDFDQSAVRADVAGLGAVLYEIACGFEPVTEDDSSRPKRLSDIDWSIPAEYEAVVERALDRSRSDRFTSASQVRETLSRSVPYLDVESREPFRRSRRMASVAACAAVGIFAVGFMLSGHGTTSRQVAAGRTTNTESTPATQTPEPFVDSPNVTTAIAPPDGTPSAAAFTPVPVLASPSQGQILAEPKSVPGALVQQPPATARPPAPAPVATTTTAKPVVPTPTTSAPATTTTAPGRLTAPANVHVTQLSTTTAQLSWNAVQYATGYVVQLKQGNASGTVVSGPSNVTPAVANFSGLKTKTTYTALIWPSDASIHGGPGSNQPHTEFTFTTN